jgi:hypothetical protein
MEATPQPRPDTLAARGWPRLAGRARPMLDGTALFALACLLFAFVQFGTGSLADNDAYYHITMGRLIRQQGLTPPFVWLPLSILNRAAFYDHHMLYHVYLALFIGDGSPDSMLQGAKVASVIMPALAFVSIWWLLRGQGVRWPAIWMLGLFATSQAFLFRMSMTRAQSASLLILALGLHWLLQRRYRPLVVLGLVYVWLYNAFPLLLAVAGIYAVATFATERRVEWRALAYPALGIALGLLANPYFPRDITFVIEHLAPKVGAPSTSVGNEWYPYDTWTLIENSGLALAIWLLGVLGLGWRTRPIDRATLAALLLSIAFGFLLFKSRRFVEYFPPFALIFAALSLSPPVERWAATRARASIYVPLLMLGALAVPLAITLPQARAAVHDQAAPRDMYAGASQWLRDNTPPGSMVFQTDWDDFPLLLFHNTSNTYTIGLDPTYMERYNPDLYAEWVRITRGEVARPSQAIRSRFGGAYVLTDLRHKEFLQQAKSDPGLQEVYRDRDAVVFAVRD